MRKAIHSARILAPAIAILLAPAAARAADPSIQAFEAAQEAAWNAHDALAYGVTLDTDARVITAQGWRWSGQVEVMRNLADGFKLVYAHARLRTSDLQVRMLSPDLASVMLRWSISGARALDGAPQAAEQQGYQTQLLQRRGDGWIILAQQDTPVTAPIPVVSNSSDDPAAAPQAFPTTPPPVRRCKLARGNGECLIYGKARPAPAS